MDRKETVSKDQAVRRIAHNDFILVSRQLLINRADTDPDKGSARMLIIYSSGKQHIVTFKLPNLACRVQDLFFQMDLQIDESTTIDCIENAGGIIHLVVSVGFPISDNIAETVAHAEEFYRKVHQSKASSADAAPPNAMAGEEHSPAVVKPSETAVANNGCQPAASATKGKKHKKSPCGSPGENNDGQVILSADQDANTNTKAKKQKKCHIAKDNNGIQAASSHDNPSSSGNKQGSHNSTAITSNSTMTSNSLRGVQPAEDAPAISQWIQSRNNAAVSKKSEETAGGSQSRVQSNVASISSPAVKATSDAAIPTPAERAERSRLRRNRNWILSRDVDEDAVVLVSSGDEETTAADDGQTERRLSPDENQTLFTYPPTGTGGLSITIKDFMCLSKGSYLNDIIIDFYLRWLKNNIIPEEQRDRTHIFSTFFHKRLTTRTNPRNTKQTAAQKRHERVEKWTRNVNIFDKDFIIIPFNEQSHWILAIICYPNLRSPVVNNNNVQTTLSDDIPIKQPLILIFDSLAVTSRHRAIAILRDYLTCEHKAKYPNALAHIFNKDNMPGHSVEVPQQQNLTDCGLYLLQYVEQFFTKPINDYTLPIKELSNWFDLLTVTKKREDIANLIKKLMNESNQQRKILPVIKFPTLNGQLVMDEEDSEEENSKEEHKTTLVCSKDRKPPRRRNTLK